jgi:hypothetical protein
MRIGIDLDGTAWSHRELFKSLIRGLQREGHSVGILTAHTGLEVPDLDLWDRRGFPKPDFYCSKVNGEESIPTKKWKMSKAKELNIDYIIDDFDSFDIINIVRI